MDRVCHMIEHESLQSDVIIPDYSITNKDTLFYRTVEMMTKFKVVRVIFAHLQPATLIAQ